MAIEKVIEHRDGVAAARVEIGSFGHELLTMRNGRKWTVQPINPELAKLIIETLTEYIKSID